ncbi:SRPBCC domain-containing protein [Anaeromyxobacter oryzae]|uniref:Activator of Hsp90 ATPase homologue 1/2-like C-terminal domain-containing protein n=1 Tax=Anaeromyxobacter oryzae TaxID=2918170 RepID=A0ABM7WPP4_9BACT|nr:SRPBCC domain-containing protein [Anaeromyxobacter oryzae]BDG01426.1 hypothetical protein AMOR_04220 [Anaeromyxobacter oryzae]
MAAGSVEAGAGAGASDRELVAARELDAPRDLVWTAWSEPTHVARWWGPRGFTNTVEHMDVRPGGAWRFVMHGPDGTDFRNEMRYVEVVSPERIVMDHVSGPNFRMTVTFAERGGRTTVTVRMTFESAAERDRAVEQFHADVGLRENLDKLGEYLGATTAARPPEEMVVTRVLDAPRPVVFEAWARPEHLARWWGPRGFTLSSCSIDFRPGGAYRMVMRGPDGADYPFHGVYREIVPPARIVFSAVIGPGPGNAVRTVVTFEEEGWKTRLTVRQTVPAMEGAARGQRQGWTESLERLADDLAALG